MKVGGGGGSTSCRGCFTPRKEPWYLLNRRLGMLQGRCGWFWERKISCLCQDLNPRSSISQPVTILTTLSHLFRYLTTNNLQQYTFYLRFILNVTVIGNSSSLYLGDPWLLCGCKVAVLILSTANRVPDCLTQCWTISICLSSSQCVSIRSISLFSFHLVASCLRETT